MDCNVGNSGSIPGGGVAMHGDGTPWRGSPRDTTGVGSSAGKRKLETVAGERERGQRVGTVRALFLKTRRGVPMTPVDSLTLRRHLGIEGDAHATPLSPRQVLVQASGGRQQANDGCAQAWIKPS